jgi:putative hemolysin
LLQVLLIALNAFFSCAEVAVLSVNETKLDKKASEGDKKASRLERIAKQPGKILTAVKAAATLFGLLGSAFASVNFSHRLVSLLLSLGVTMSQSALNALSVVIITLAVSFLTILLGDIVPKRIAVERSESLAYEMSGVISMTSRLFAPFAFLLTASANGALRLFGIDPSDAADDVSEEEIRMMVDAGSKNGVIDDDEKDIIQNVFEFDDTPVEQFATHRTDLCILWLEETDEEWAAAIKESRHSVYPVCGESIDDIVGVLYTKDYFRLEDKSRDLVMKYAVKPAAFVPYSAYADVLLRQMKRTRNHFAVVLDEYGGTLGIVTMSDLLEQLVGDIGEADDEPEPLEIVPLGEDRWKILGTAPLDEVAEALNVELPAEDHDTFGGYVLACRGSLPEDGATFELDTDELHITVDTIKDHRIESAVVQVMHSEEKQ